MEITERIVDSVVVLELKGKLTVAGPQTLLQETVQRYLGQNNTRLVLDLNNIRYIDNFGLATLVSSYTEAINNGGGLVLCRITQGTKDLLQNTKLLTVFDVFDDQAKAIASLKPNS